jgi:ATP-dependent Lhr-like helicase
MRSFQLLSKHMQKKIWDMGWEHFTPIQDQTIPVIINSDYDIVISSGTASGKTEAAFLPILTIVEKIAKDNLKVLYISPLKALINNQFERIEKLCQYNHIPIHRWHGDVDQNKKKKFVQSPSGILQITPESIESLFINRTEYLKHIFEDIEFVIIDEIHSFLDNERGVHLRSLLSRIERYCAKKPRIIGLSATIDNFSLVKEWINLEDPDNVKIIESKGFDKELNYNLMHFQTGEDRKKPIELYEDMRELTRNSQTLIFCNSRGDVEETTVFLNRLADRESVGETYFAHHSSIDKKEREYVEKTLSNSTSPKSVIATSSLELGIDIGEIELVIQVDSTFTVSSLKQRLGRSGRKKDSNQFLQLYTTEEDSLVQSLAVMELLLEQWVEPANGYPMPYDILFHQLISICHETNGITKENLLERVKSIPMFRSINTGSIDHLIRHMVENDYLEVIKGRNELIVGLEGERLLRSKDFYAVFMTSEEYEVLEGMRKIGQLDKGSFINIGDNIILAGKLWTIKDIDDKRNKVYVSKAINAKRPNYSGGGAKLHPRIPEKMMEILCSEKEYVYVDESGIDTLKDVRKAYHMYEVTPNYRMIWVTKGEVLFETYTGNVIAKTLMWMLRYMGVESKSIDGIGRIKFDDTYPFMEILHQLKEKNWEAIDLIPFIKDREFFSSKYFVYLPEDLKIIMHIAHEIDIQGVKEYLNRYEFKVVTLIE